VRRDQLNALQIIAEMGGIFPVETLVATDSAKARTMESEARSRGSMVTLS